PRTTTAPTSRKSRDHRRRGLARGAYPGARRALRSYASAVDRGHDPGDHLVEHVAQARRRLEPEHALGLLRRRDAPLYVVLERRIRHDTERGLRAPALPP